MTKRRSDEDRRAFEQPSLSTARATGSAAVGLPVVRGWYLGLVAAMLLLYYVGRGTRPFAAAGIGALSVAAVVFGIVVLRPQRSGAWALLGLAVALLSTGDTIFAFFTRFPTVQVDYPSLPDAFYLAAYLPLVVGVLWLGQPRTPSRDWPLLLDTAVLTLAGGLLVWLTVVRPEVITHRLTDLGQFVATASWLGYVAVVAACLCVLPVWRANLAVIILAVGVVAFLLSDYLHSASLTTGQALTNGGPIDGGFLLFCALCGAAALTSSMAALGSARHVHRHLGPWRLATLVIALLVAPTVLLVQATTGSVTSGAAIAVVSAAVGVLIVFRLVLSVRAYRVRTLCQHAARVALRTMVVATSGDEVTAGLGVALRSMVVDSARSSVRLRQSSAPSTLDGLSASDEVPNAGAPTIGAPAIGAPASAGSAVAASIASAERGDWGELVVGGGGSGMAESCGREVVYAAPLSDLVELSPVLQTLAEQGLAAIARIDLVEALRTEERESYFRTLVQTSTDAILICRHGRIDYASPSAETIFGRDVHLELFEDVVTREPIRDPKAAADTAAAWGEAAEGAVHCPDGTTRTVLVHSRDLLADPTVNGVVATVRDVTEERDLRRTLAYQASHDALTGLANVDVLRERLSADRAEAGQAEGESLSRGGRLDAVLFLDIDDFKEVNDSYGHEVGDKVLISVAQRIESCVRDADIAARVGGDEFAVLLRDVSAPEVAVAAAQRIAKELAQPVALADIHVEAAASIGVAVAAAPAEFDSLLRQADAALYAAKADGKGRWREYEDGMLSPARRRSDLLAGLDNAVRDLTLALRYQPIVDLATGRAEGFEALIWDNRGAAPDASARELIEIAQDHGLTGPLGDWVIRQALADWRILNSTALGRHRYVAVNVSARQLRQATFGDRVRERLSAAGVDPRYLVIEVTGADVAALDELSWRQLARLRREGVRLAIDDFGAGDLPLAHLRQAEIDTIKIHHSLLVDLASERNRSVLAAVLLLAQRIGLDQVAAGVEDDSTRDTLQALGFSVGQGPLFAPALPVTQAMLF